MGDELGGRPSDPDLYVEGHVDYPRVRESEAFQRGLGRLEKGLQSGHRIVLLCSEQRPEMCHRSKLVGLDLDERGYEVMHIEGDGSLVDHQQVMRRLTGGQETLFGDHDALARSKYSRRDG
jgi:uncharacterized protein (DUF488 family)